MRLHLNQRWVRHLCSLPETGMGYQIVDVILRNGERVQSIVVYNAEEMDWPAQRRPIKPEDIVDIRKAAN